MAAKKTQEKAKVKAKPPSQKAGFKAQLLMIFVIIAAAVFLPSTVLLCVGMMPTLVAAFVDRSKKKSKIFTVGSMNLAGCAPFLLELWQRGHHFERAIDIISNPQAVIVMYSAAVIGYMIDWAVAGLVANLLYHRGVARQKAIKSRQKELVERWGREVTGELPLDEQGFPIQGIARAEPAKSGA